MAMAPSRGSLAYGSPAQGALRLSSTQLRNFSEDESTRAHDETTDRVSSGLQATSSGRFKQGLGEEKRLPTVEDSKQRGFKRKDQALGEGLEAEKRLPTIDESKQRVSGRTGVTWGESLKYAASSWVLGLFEALKVHRTVRIFLKSRPVLIRTGQCSLLNGFFFLGSILMLEGFLDPSLRYLLDLPHTLGSETSDVGRMGTLHSFLLGLYNTLWLYPIYIISFIINCMWHQDIAKRAYEALREDQSLASALGVESRDLLKPASPASAKQGSSGLETLVTMIGEEVYRVVMFAVFVAQVYAVSLVPYVGLGLNFLLLSWLYAYYCFDYKWSSAGWTLDERLSFFETHWAFFAGFGTPCTVATFFLPFFASAAVWALVFPLFVLVATTCNPARVVAKSLGNDPVAVHKSQAWRVPIFRFASVQSVVFLKFILPSSSD